MKNFNLPCVVGASVGVGPEQRTEINSISLAILNNSWVRINNCSELHVNAVKCKMSLCAGVSSEKSHQNICDESQHIVEQTCTDHARLVQQVL